MSYIDTALRGYTKKYQAPADKQGAKAPKREAKPSIPSLDLSSFQVTFQHQYLKPELNRTESEWVILPELNTQVKSQKRSPLKHDSEWVIVDSPNTNSPLSYRPIMQSRKSRKSSSIIHVKSKRQTTHTTYTSEVKQYRRFIHHIVKSASQILKHGNKKDPRTVFLALNYVREALMSSDLDSKIVLTMLKKKIASIKNAKFIAILSTIAEDYSDTDDKSGTNKQSLYNKVDLFLSCRLGSGYSDGHFKDFDNSHSESRELKRYVKRHHCLNTIQKKQFIKAYKRFISFQGSFCII